VRHEEHGDLAVLQLLELLNAAMAKMASPPQGFVDDQDFGST